MPRTTGTTDAEATRDFSIEAARLLADRRCEDVRLLDVRGKSQVCDFILIASGTSDRQMKSVAGELRELADERQMPVFRRASDDSNTWVVTDFVDLVVHLFEPNLREYYDLDGLWADADRLDWRRDDQKPNHRHRGEIGYGGYLGDDGEEE